MKPLLRHLIARTALGVSAAGTIPLMTAGGYVDGAPTVAGLDAGTLKYALSLVLAIATVFYPQIPQVWKSLMNNPRVDALEARVAALEASASPAESAEASQPIEKTTRKTRARK